MNCFYIPTSHEETINAITNSTFVFPKIDSEETLKYGYWNENFGIKYQKYEPINISKGTYKGKKIKANRITSELKRFFNNKK
ncbi:hypothetical protein [Flavobacterium sp.]|uniref:hypothetical protein n=1 Tax=Flavobacterium sp. TaxID=239 RepID=UPI004048D810